MNAYGVELACTACDGIYKNMRYAVLELSNAANLFLGEYVLLEAGTKT
jgi:hypothetical protein